MGRRGLLAAVLVGTAVLLQATTVARLALPAGGPQLLVLVVSAVGLGGGPSAGMLAGFGGGLLADLAPPSDRPLGQSALLLVLVGLVAGLLRGDGRSGLLRGLAVVALLSVGALLGAAAFGLLLAQPQQSWGRLLGGALATAAYDVLLAPLVLPRLQARRHRVPRRGRRRPARVPAVLR